MRLPPVVAAVVAVALAAPALAGGPGGPGAAASPLVGSAAPAPSAASPSSAASASSAAAAVTVGASARPAAAPLTGLDSTAPAPDPAALAGALAGPIADRALAGGLTVRVVDVATGTLLFDRPGVADADGVPVVEPASTIKLLVAAAALSVLGPDERLRTTLVGAPVGPDGVVHGDARLVGAGDQTLTDGTGPAWPHTGSIDALADAAVAAGVRRVTGRVVPDTSLFSGPPTAPGWKPGYLTGGSVAGVEPLSVLGGRTGPGLTPPRVADPAAAAAGMLRDALRARGVVVDDVDPAGDPAAGASAAPQVLAATESPPVSDLVAWTLSRSDNDMAESLGRLVAIRQGLPATFDGAAHAVTAAVSALGVPVAGLVLRDTSGLSTDDRVAPETVLRLIRLAAGGDHPELRPMLVGLAVAGLDGTLADRFRSGPAAAGAGVVRAKTGYLTGVAALAGVVVDADGRALAFGLWARGPALARDPAEQALDRVAATLAGCGCR